MFYKKIISIVIVLVFIISQSHIKVKAIPLFANEIFVNNGSFGSVSDDGSFYAWGRNQGAWGTKNSDWQNGFSMAGENVVSADFGGNDFKFGVYCDSNGRVYGVGNNIFHQFYNSDFINDWTVIDDIYNIKGVSAGSGHVLYLDKDGNIFSSGKNSHYQLGYQKQSPYDRPMQVLKVPKAIKIDAGNNISCALTEDGKAYFWGEGYNGIYELEFDKRIIDISISQDGKNCLILDEDNYVYGKGDNLYFQLGVGQRDVPDFTKIYPDRVTKIFSAPKYSLICDNQNNIKLCGVFSNIFNKEFLPIISDVRDFCGDEEQIAVRKIDNSIVIFSLTDSKNLSENTLVYKNNISPIELNSYFTSYINDSNVYLSWAHNDNIKAYKLYKYYKNKSADVIILKNDTYYYNDIVEDDTTYILCAIDSNDNCIYLSYKHISILNEPILKLREAPTNQNGETISLLNLNYISLSMSQYNSQYSNIINCYLVILDEFDKIINIKIEKVLVDKNINSFLIKVPEMNLDSKKIRLLFWNDNMYSFSQKITIDLY